MSEIYEFYAPFVHVPGRYEWARIHSPTHGSFDTFIVIETTTDRPVTVYVNSDAGAHFMAARYPESVAIRVPAAALRIESDAWSAVVDGELVAEGGSIRRAWMRFSRVGEDLPRVVPYGGDDFPVWGSRFTCYGVDMELSARVEGVIERSDRTEPLVGEAGIITLGSFGRITEIAGR